MKAKDLRKLIGHQITWVECYDPYRGGINRSGTLVDVQGRNALIDFGGQTDWKWIPDMRFLQLKQSEEDKQ